MPASIWQKYFMPLNAETGWDEITIKKNKTKLLKVMKEKIAKESIITTIQETG